MWSQNPHYCRYLHTLSVGRRACSLRTRPQKRITMKMVAFGTAEATIKIKHFRRGAHSNGTYILATIADSKTAASGS